MNKISNTVIYKEAQESFDFEDDSVLFSEDLEFESPDDIEIYSEESLADDGLTVEEALHGFTDSEYEEPTLGDVADQLESIDEDIKEFSEEHGDEPVSNFIPGSDAVEDDFADDSDEEDEGDYLTTGNIKKFMEYITDMYPAKIPRHDGKTTLGCERAKSFLERMDKEISSAIRKDHDGVLEISKLEELRQKIIGDVAKLASHIKLLKSNENKKKASVDANGIPAWTDSAGVEHSYSDMRKTAATPNKMVIAVPPFERAIAGIMINAHVSAGHNMEDVYDYLANKYAITAREELSIMQVCMDSGFHIFKDRGTYSGEKEDKEGSHAKRGVDFVRNYFA